MSKLIILLSFLFCFSCHAQTPSAKPDVAKLKWNLREALRDQLPGTVQQPRGTVMLSKSYSFDFSPPGADSSIVWEIPEKMRDSISNAIQFGGKYFLPAKSIDFQGIQIVYQKNKTQQGITIPAKKGMSFVYHPYTIEPDVPVQSVFIGWYDRRQDWTLPKVLKMMKELEGNE